MLGFMIGAAFAACGLLADLGSFCAKPEAYTMFRTLEQDIFHRRGQWCAAVFPNVAAGIAAAVFASAAVRPGHSFSIASLNLPIGENR